MGPELLEIIPRELKFTFELKKQSSCSVQLVNNSNQYVAFKVKTTSPKKYCVRPNTGIIHPKSTCDFTVTMQAQRVAPPDMQCKDKFLIQGTIVPYGTAAEAITPSTFAKDNGQYIDENKLKVVLLSPPHSPVLLPINGHLKQDYESSTLRDQVLSGVENLPPPHKVAKDEEQLKASNDGEELKPAKGVNELKLAKEVEELRKTKDEEHLKPSNDAEELKPAKGVELKQTQDTELKLAKKVEELRQTKGEGHLKPSKDVEDVQPAKDVEESKHTKDVELKLAKEVEELKQIEDMEELKQTKDEELQLAKDVEELKFKLEELESKLNEAEITITMLREERSTTIVETQTLQQQLVTLRKKKGASTDEVGFPFLFVCIVALISVAIGYLLRH